MVAETKRLLAQQPTPGPWLTYYVGSEIGRVLASKLEPLGPMVTSDTDLKVLCSYTWVDKPSPAICVPGKFNTAMTRRFCFLTSSGGAAFWDPIPVPQILPANTSLHVLDWNAHKSPTFSFEAVFHALDTMQPGLLFDDIDLLIDVDSLVKLFDFTAKVDSPPFRMHAYILYNTLIIEKYEKEAAQIMLPESEEFGTSLADKVTSKPKGFEDTAGHYQIIQYQLGDLKCAVRVKVDAQLHSEEADNAGEQRNDPETSTFLGGPMGIRVDHCGHASSQESLIAMDINLLLRNMDVYIPHLWFGRLQNLARVVHCKLLFRSMLFNETQEVCDAWEQRPWNKENLQKLVYLLKGIQDVTYNNIDKSSVIIYSEENRPKMLRFYSHLGPKPKPLPGFIVSKFWKQGGGEGASGLHNMPMTEEPVIKEEEALIW